MEIDNVMFAKEGDYETVKLVDFGLSAKYNGRLSITLNEKCGTDTYMAPEVFSSHSYSKVFFSHYYLVRGHMEYWNYYVCFAYRSASPTCKR